MTENTIPLSLIHKRREWFWDFIDYLAAYGEDLREAGIPRVSDLLRPVSDLSHIPADILQNAADRGTEVHHWIEGEIAFRTAGFTNPSIPKSGRYAYSWQKWGDQVELYDSAKPNYQMWATETPIGFKSSHGTYRGTIDLIRYDPYKNRIQVLDWKTSAKPYPTHAIQLTLYRMAVAGMLDNRPPPITEEFPTLLQHAMALAVYLKKDGSEPVVEEASPDNWRIAKALISIHEFRYEHDIRYKNRLLAQHHEDLG